ncbi:uncharacterized protein FA14DRAFT_177862 [Meira miltonrushii]|uniref:Amino acid transporter n=1 Tax=Meira miltonrushii TaxID=1280837 RepID=A0A316VMR3_9BASI|nr:uncharacterized protein FA14DRAFT_177862 [Meira miltonrushii]PWN38600.1 hypothetical protein FA14DRAFT_177862 [Meira miltonrushii]
MNSEEVEKKDVMQADESQNKHVSVYTIDFPTNSELRKKLNRPAVVAIGYLIVTTWSAYSTASATALVAGGLNVFFWGLLITVFCIICAAASLAEPASLCPYGNQAQWCSILTPNKMIATANIASLIWNVCGFLLISIFMLVQSRGHYNSAKTAFITISNQSGWSTSFVPWVSGLSQAALSTTAFDAVAHLAYEMHEPHKDVPFGMLSAIGTNGIIGLLYAVIFIFCLPANAFDLLTTPTGFPFGQFLLNLTHGSQVGTVFLILVFFIPLLFTGVDLYVTTSRIACGFASQGGLPNLVGKVNQRIDAPIFAFIFVGIINVCLAWIYVGSTAAFTAFISAPAVVLGWTYSAVAASMLFYGRPVKQIKTKFNLGSILGPFANIVTIIFYLCLTVFLSLPPTYPVSASSMNFTSVILVASILAPILTWFLYAKRFYRPIVTD